MSESLPEVMAHLDDFERDLWAMASKVREYRHTLFAAYSAQGIDTPDDLVVGCPYDCTQCNPDE